MSRHVPMRRVFERAITPVAIGAVLAAVPAAGQPQALVPVPVPHFSIDLASPSVGKPTVGGPITAGAILDRPGPTATYAAQGLGLLQPNDELDEMSGNRAIDVAMGQTFVVLFGVDRATVGARGPDPSLLPSRPFNVQEQAARGQAACDQYMTLDGWNRAGGPLPFEEGRVVILRNNTLVNNQGDTGGGDFDSDPDVPPLLTIPPGTPIDEGDGSYYDPGAPLPMATTEFRVVQSQTVYYTVSKHSSVPGQPPLPVVPSGANIYVDTNPAALGGEAVYATAAQLGLQNGPAGDDIDGLIVFDQNNNNSYDAGDQVVFSLSRNSPSLGGLRSAADLFVANGPCVGPCCSCNLFARANDLGLDPMFDNVDNIELLKTDDVATTVYESAIYYVLPGDYDDDGVLTPLDCESFASCCTGPGVPATEPCLAYDMDGDGDVDGRDLLVFGLIYRQETGGDSCLPQTIVDFVNVLLTKAPGTQACMADLNADGAANGDDIRLYVLMSLGQWPL